MKGAANTTFRNRYLRSPHAFIEAILSTNNPGAAGKFYTTDYVLVPAD